MNSAILHKIALSIIPGLTSDIYRNICESGVSILNFFDLNMPDLVNALGQNSGINLQNAIREEALIKARKELDFIKRHSIRVLFIDDDDYPVLLRETPDAPLILYVLGKTDLNTSPVIDIVGTRRCTAYGTSFCSSFINDISHYYPNSIIVSGLAFGIDSAAHKAALENGLTTVAVLAHGLDTIYPAANRELARLILKSGGALISEYPSGSRPFQRNFLQRNRIVAGMSEATVVVESEIRGGAMSTANLAFSYSREVFAVPGRYSDITSSGCNMLIANNKANIFTSIADFINTMNWVIPAIGTTAPVKSLFPELEGDMALIYSILHKSGVPLKIDDIHMKSGLPMPSLMVALTDLEFEGIILKLPGARYELC